MVNPKTKWLSFLFLAIVLFLLGMYTQQLLFFFATIGVMFYIRQKGYEVLFKEFDDERKTKRLKVESLMKEAKLKKQTEKRNSEIQLATKIAEEERK